MPLSAQHGPARFRNDVLCATRRRLTPSSRPSKCLIASRRANQLCLRCNELAHECQRFLNPAVAVRPVVCKEVSVCRCNSEITLFPCVYVETCRCKAQCMVPCERREAYFRPMRPHEVGIESAQGRTLFLRTLKLKALHKGRRAPRHEGSPKVSVCLPAPQQSYPRAPGCSLKRALLLGK